MFSDTLKRLRESANLSQQALAKLVGMSAGGIAQLEQGRREPSLKTAQKLAVALGVDCTAFNEAQEAKPAKKRRPK